MSEMKVTKMHPLLRKCKQGLMRYSPSAEFRTAGTLLFMEEFKR